MGRNKKHIFIIDKKRDDIFYIVLGLKKDYIDVLKCWIRTRDIDRGIIERKNMDGKEIIESSYENFIRTKAFPSDEEVGWLEPDGTFYKCGMWNHAYFAWWYFGVFETELENKGFVKVATNYGTNKRAYSSGYIITEAQYNKLKSIGFSKKDIAHFRVVH